jgi:hypothetical protein
MTNPKCELKGCSNRAMSIGEVTIINQDGSQFDCLICRKHFNEFSNEKPKVTFDYTWRKP